MKVRKMEIAENSDLDTSLAPVNMEIFFENKNLEEKFRLNTHICVFNSVRRYAYIYRLAVARKYF